MTQGTYKGLSAPADELDIIEAYGGTGPTHPNQKGYWTTSHTWNQPDKQPGVYQQNPMTTIGGGSSWWETFHIYGFKITETDTIYYCDNVDMARHPTSRLCKTDPLFFMINLATGGGWPVDLSRYNGVVDMYVDYVRVYSSASTK
jgi:beta-glucanase (GH16 family)